MIRRPLSLLQPGDIVRRGDGYQTVEVEAVEVYVDAGFVSVHFAVWPWDRPDRRPRSITATSPTPTGRRPRSSVSWPLPTEPSYEVVASATLSAIA